MRPRSTARHAARVALLLCGLGAVAGCKSHDRSGSPSATTDDGGSDTVSSGALSTSQGATSTSGGFGASCGLESCSPGSDTTGASGPSNGSGGQTGSAANTGPFPTTSGMGGGPTGPAGGEACRGQSPMGVAGATSCAASGYDIPPLGVDMYVMLDHTLSMENEIGVAGTTRWELTTTSIHEFLDVLDSDSRLANTGIGVELFSWVDDADCAFEPYANPDVEIGPFAANAQAIEGLLASDPIGQTPTYPALMGALSYARDWAIQHPDRRTVVVFVTDGDPNRCSPIDGSAIALQASGSLQGYPRVPVYFVGIDGSYGLGPVAEAAGTGAVSEITIRGSVEEAVDEFVEILQDIAQPWQPCEFDLPEGWMELGRPEVTYEDESGDLLEVDLLDGAGDCATSLSGGFFYSGWTLSGEPNQVSLCSCTCNALQGTEVKLTADCGSGF